MDQSGAAEALAGSLGGMLSLAMTYPLYTIVMRCQQNHGQKPDANADNTSLDTRKKSRKYFLQVLVSALSEKPGELYKGVGAGTFAVGVQCLVYYYYFARFQSWHRKAQAAATTTSLMKLVTGYEAGVVTVLLTNPLWVVNYRQMSSSGQQKSWLGSLQQVLAAEGVAGLFSGVVPAIILCVNPAIQFFSMEVTINALQLRHQSLHSHQSIHRLPASTLFLLGAWSKAISTILSYPIQTVRTSLTKTDKSDGSGFNGLSDCVRRILVHEGVRGFYNGLSFKLLQTTLTAAFLQLIRLRMVPLLQKLLRTRAHIKIR